jgi:hypothetical protein
LVAGTHRPPALQQPAQAARSHTHAPEVQVCDGAQAAHAAPAVPHAAVVGGFTHCPFWSQQPFGHEDGEQRGTSLPASWLDPAADPPAPPRALAPADPPAAALAEPALPPAPAVTLEPPDVPARFDPADPPGPPTPPPAPPEPGPLPAAPVVIPTPRTQPVSAAGITVSNVHTTKRSRSKRISAPFNPG